MSSLFYDYFGNQFAARTHARAHTHTHGHTLIYFFLLYFSFLWSFKLWEWLEHYRWSNFNTTIDIKTSKVNRCDSILALLTKRWNVFLSALCGYTEYQEDACMLLEPSGGTCPYFLKLQCSTGGQCHFPFAILLFCHWPISALVCTLCSVPSNFMLTE